MTREEIADALDVAAYTVQEPVGLARLADAVRALPVLATCGECGWATDDPESPSDPGSGEWCGRDAKRRQIRTDAAPPSWCPLRGKR